MPKDLLFWLVETLLGDRISLMRPRMTRPKAPESSSALFHVAHGRAFALRLPWNVNRSVLRLCSLINIQGCQKTIRSGETLSLPECVCETLYLCDADSVTPSVMWGSRVGLVQTENHQMPQGLDQSFCTKHCFCTCLSSSPLCVHLPRSVMSCLLGSVQQIIADFYMKSSLDETSGKFGMNVH